MKPTSDELDALIDYQSEKLEFEESLAPAQRANTEFAALAFQTREALQYLKENL